MAIPDFQSIMLPLLEFLGDRQEKSNQEINDALAEVFQLTEEEINQLLPSGNQKIFANRVAWAKAYLKRASLITSPRRGYALITDRGLTVLTENPEKLKQFPEYLAFSSLIKDGQNAINIGTNSRGTTPEETLELSFQNINETLSKELIIKIKECPPAFFEKLVIDLLLAMGYGGSRQEAGRVVGKSGDGGIDGVINEDKLGLDSIYVQAKRWEGSVSRPTIQQFAGALAGKKAKKGIFITTSSYTKEAQEYVSTIDSRIILIDGEYLAKLMIDHDIGVTKIRSYDLKRIDSDYFIED